MFLEIKNMIKIKLSVKCFEDKVWEISQKVKRKEKEMERIREKQRGI